MNVTRVVCFFPDLSTRQFYPVLVLPKRETKARQMKNFHTPLAFLEPALGRIYDLKVKNSIKKSFCPHKVGEANKVRNEKMANI